MTTTRVVGATAGRWRGGRQLNWAQSTVGSESGIHSECACVSSVVASSEWQSVLVWLVGIRNRSE